MLRCWSCEGNFNAKVAWKASILRSRAAANGGPYRTYRCPLCLKLSRIESTPRGRLFASPDREIGLLDYLFGWAGAQGMEVLGTNDFLRVAQWHQLYGDRRRAFFLRDGDSRYTKGRLIDRLRARLFRFLGRRQVTLDPGLNSTRANEPTGRTPEQADDKSKPQEPTPQRPPLPPHPYRILGVSTTASPAQIRTAFRRLAKKWHPDKQASADPQELERATRRLAELVSAYEQITKQNPPQQNSARG